MLRNLEISKQTEDRVKLAKQYVESKYQAILQQERNHKMNMQRVMKALSQTPLLPAQKKAVANQVLAREAAQTRMMRIKDRLSNYDLLGMIGKGAFGDVRLARIKENEQIVAIKRMAKEKLVDKKQVASVFLQRQCLSRSHSPWLVELRSAFQDPQFLYIAMQWIPGGDLLRLLIEKDIFTESQTRFYVAELILALEDMHKMHYIHRDIKPDNILIDKTGHLKLTDFGLSKHLQSKPKISFQRNSTKPRSSFKPSFGPRPRHFSKVGTPDYIAPEVLTESTYDHRVDIWSVGVIMFECLFGYPLFSHEDSKQVCQRVMNWEEYLVFPQTPKVSIQAKLLILGMLSSPQQRLSIPQIKSHPFFHGIDWAKVRNMTPPFIPPMTHQLDTANFDAFEDAEEWVDLERRDERKSQEVRSSSIGYQYNFAGFDWQPRPQNPHLSSTLKQIENLAKRRSSPTGLRRLKTETGQCERQSIPEVRAVRNSLKMYERRSREDRGLKKVGAKPRA